MRLVIQPPIFTQNQYWMDWSLRSYSHSHAWPQNPDQHISVVDMARCFHSFGGFFSSSQWAEWKKQTDLSIYTDMVDGGIPSARTLYSDSCSLWSRKKSQRVPSTEVYKTINFCWAGKDTQWSEFGWSLLISVWKGLEWSLICGGISQSSEERGI